MLRTKNLQIDSELLKRLDRAYYNQKIIPSNNVINRRKMYQTELLEFICSRVDDRFYAIIQNRCLYYLYGVAERLLIEEGKPISERIKQND